MNFIPIIFLLILFPVLSIAAQDKSASKTLIDPRDKKEYKTIEIGSQIWTAENLRFRQANMQKAWCYADEESNCEKYGVLYSWESAIEACPQGWRMPAAQDWEKLIAALKTQAEQQSADVNHILLAENGFHALYAGFRAGNGKYVLLGSHTLFWSNEIDTGFSEQAQRFGRYFGRHLYEQDKSTIKFEPSRGTPDTGRSLRYVQN